MDTMRNAAVSLLVGLLLSGPAAAQTTAGPAGRVHVSDVAPEGFTDVEDEFGSAPTLRVRLAEMTHILERLGQARLRPGEILDLKVLDIDRAGFDRPGFGGTNGVRVVTDATPPRIGLAYVPRRGGRVVAGRGHRHRHQRQAHRQPGLLDRRPA